MQHPKNLVFIGNVNLEDKKLCLSCGQKWKINFYIPEIALGYNELFIRTQKN